MASACCKSLPFGKPSRETLAMALSGKFDVNCLPPGKKPPAVRPGRAVLTGAPRKAGERLVDDLRRSCDSKLFNLDGKAKAASATAFALPAKARERSGGAVQPVTSQKPT
jgi:hypothetical protein